MIVYRATVRGVTTVDITLDVIPAPEDDEQAFGLESDELRVNVPGATNAHDVGALLRAFGALIEVHGAVRITIEPDPDGAPARRE